MHRSTHPLSRLFSGCLLVAACATSWLAPTPAAAQTEALKPGSGIYTFTTSAGASIRVFYHLPEGVGPDRPVLFVMHGVQRDADRYFDEWKQHADRYRVLLAVPEFSQADFPGDNGYILGNVFTEAGRPNPPAKWSYSAIEPLFDDLLVRSGNRSKGYYIYGHSAGSQFVHRMLYFQPQSRAIKAVAANAGWYTLPVTDADFPYGLNNTQVSEADLRGALSRPLLILLGTRDNDPNHRHLRRAPEAMQQGHHRFERGHNFYFTGEKAARALNTPFGWEIQWVPGVAHSNRRMSGAAAEFLFGTRP